MNILVIGSGGREHALVWKLAQSPRVERIFCAPGNAGIAGLATCVDIGVRDMAGLASFAVKEDIGLTVVGPEDPLALGIVDYFQERGLRVFGPSKAAAQLEASKSFAKDAMTRYGIPTAEYSEFTCPDEAIAYIRNMGAPLVIKADGLAAGKGVTVAEDVEAAINAVRQAMVDKSFGEAGARVVIEEKLIGEEASILAFSDGRTVLPMASSQDHKPAYDDDKGPNTGGMGAYSPAPVVTSDLEDEILRAVLRPCIEGMARDGAPYVGVLYAGLIITKDGPKVIEFNCRFGDPETQVVLPRLRNDLLDVLLACCDGSLHEQSLDWTPGSCVSVVMASGGYPGAYAKGLPIQGLDKAETLKDVCVFHAGTNQAHDGLIVTNGGRVLNVTATAGDVGEAIAKAYQAVDCIHFEGAHFRRDIGGKALARLR